MGRHCSIWQCSPVRGISYVLVEYYGAEASAVGTTRSGVDGDVGFCFGGEERMRTPFKGNLKCMPAHQIGRCTYAALYSTMRQVIQHSMCPTRARAGKTDGLRRLVILS
jgi:hypothetical protein